MVPPAAMKRRASSVSTDELARQLDVNKYHQPWLDSRKLKQVPANTGPDETRSVRCSHDTTLTALAQLAALRLNVKRGMVSLIDSNTQIILAEATQTVSLVDERRHAPDDHIWLGNVSLPRQDCMDEHAFGASTTFEDGEGRKVEVPGFVVNDALEDDRFKHRPYVTSGASVRFYAGVPIVTKQGYAIGVYAVSDTQPRPQGITLDEAQFMGDVAQVIADHLERVMDAIGRVSERDFMRGISYFLEDLSEYKYQLSKTDRFVQPPNNNTKRQSDVQATDPQKEPTRGRLSQSKATSLPRPSSISRIRGSTSRDQVDGVQVPRFSRQRVSRGRGRETSNSSDDNIRRIFAQASQLLCQQANASGCVFTDASSGLFSRQSEGVSPHADDDPSLVLDVNFESTEDEETDGDVIEKDDELSPGCGTSLPQTNFSDRPDEMANILSSTVVNGPDDRHRRGMVKRKNLKKLILRYPFGKCFYLNNGRVVSDQTFTFDEVIAGGGASHFVLNASMNNAEEPPHKLLPRELLSCIPDAKWLIFLPLFYYAQGKWFAAGFVWGDDFKMGDPDDVLPYFKTFGSCMMSEVASMEVINTNIAKSTFIASISHELRSPLQGILGAGEFLEDTMTSAYQTSLIGAVETCGKTLLDTIDHLLDYAKINNLNRAGSSRFTGSKDGKMWKNTHGIEEPPSATFDLAILLEEVVEAVFAGQTFRKINLRHYDPVNDSTAQIKSMGIDDSSTTRELIHSGSHKFSGKVFLVLHIQKQESWCLEGQTGGLRRVIMNVVGNAIKYCTTGCIDVSLTSKQVTKSDIEVGISIKDTGIGMSQNFLSNHLFKAFTQEDSFMPGTGLGLSITSQIVQNMGGGIRVDSEKGVGTHVNIAIPMKIATTGSCDGVQSDALRDAMKATKGKKVCLLGPVIGSREGPNRELSVLESSIATFCRDWFDMTIVETDSAEANKETAIYIYAEPPPIERLVEEHLSREKEREYDKPAWLVICTNAFEAAALRAAGIQDLVSLGRTIEVISQPVGVRKLGKVLLQCIQRFEANEENKKDGIQNARSRTPSPSSARCRGDAVEVESNSSSATPSPGKGPCRPSLKDFKWKTEQLQPKIPLGKRIIPISRTSDMSNFSVTQRSRTQSRDLSAQLPRMLLVDDNAINLKLLVTFMNKIELPYVEATNGLEAVTKFKEAPDQQHFDFVLMDLQMPIMDGLEATRQIREFELEKRATGRATAPSANVIAITGVGNEDMRKEAMEAGVSQFLTKPIKFKALQQILLKQSTIGDGEGL
ncbi:uncharacterized protein GGS22DRAFT_197521 [Annulohypoxylon maeteangense]|uniref:uncharacterized protein n=1 Tax=Annulohypoxylon maeteangense TaxID=1927788 RepID=UPI0020075DBC|nr:uncharacterized protein GGS22DRAFT_197521 [Annulohypoxylon maeteangense]KAI0880454.1 hypothetical protein GGS22DRAFT_197521 [Annulohypoxylon maeteangense]